MAERSGGHCEAIIGFRVDPTNDQHMRWTRCGKSPVEIHHRITRARGGTLLDDVGEIDHLMALCREHHARAHDSDDAFNYGLLISGSVTQGPDGPRYSGPDIKLSRRYP